MLSLSKKNNSLPVLRASNKVFGRYGYTLVGEGDQIFDKAVWTVPTSCLECEKVIVGYNKDERTLVCPETGCEDKKLFKKDTPENIADKILKWRFKVK